MARVLLLRGLGFGLCPSSLRFGVFWGCRETSALASGPVPIKFLLLLVTRFGTSLGGGLLVVLVLSSVSGTGTSVTVTVTGPGPEDTGPVISGSGSGTSESIDTYCAGTISPLNFIDLNLKVSSGPYLLCLLRKCSNRAFISLNPVLRGDRKAIFRGRYLGSMNSL